MSVNHVAGKVVVVTGAGGGFGRLVCEKAAALGAKVVGADINRAGLDEMVAAVAAAGGTADGRVVDVTDLGQMHALAAFAVERHGALDVFINNAGTMPLAFFSDHAAAAEAWSRCIDINIKGVLNGMIAAHDPMITQGRGHVINISSIYGNYPVVGAAVYGATKAAVNVMSESFRVETQGKIKVTIVKPTGVPATGLGASIINRDAVVGILGQNAASYGAKMGALGAGNAQAGELDPDDIRYAALAPGDIAEQVVNLFNQPWGISLGDITIRAAGDGYIL